MPEDRVLRKFQFADHQISLGDYQDRKGNILVISPHPDDDVMGAGGTMALAAEEGRGVFSVYITDGCGSPRKEPGISNDEMAARREKEALHSLKGIGAAGGFFLGRKSREAMGAEGRTIKEELEEIIRMLKPSEVYLPAPYERHKTHQVCTRITIDALRAAVHWPSMALGYSLWGSFWGGKERISRDIGSVIRKKVDAVIAHASQIEYKNYHQGILGKNNYEAVFMESHEIQKVSFVEIFLDMTEFLFRKDLSLKTFMREDLDKFQSAFTDFPMES